MQVIIRWKSLLFLLIISLFLLFLYQTSINERPTQCVLPPELDTYCNNPLLPAEGKEGEVDPQKYQLESLHIFSRHGDRSPLHMLHAKHHSTRSFKCFYEEWLTKGIPILHDFIESMKHNKAILDTPAFQQFSIKSLLPDKMACPLGALTPTGTAQLLRNGLFLQDKYKSHVSFEDLLNIQVTSTKYSRTLHTAIAFLYGFVPHLNLSTIPFHFLTRPTLCSEHSPLKCDCPATYGQDNVLSCTFQQTWVSQLPSGGPLKSLRSEAWDIFVFNSDKPTPPPSPIFDHLVSHYCHQQQYVNNCFLGGVFSHVNTHGKKMNKNRGYHKMSLLRMLPLISEVASTIKKNHSRPFIHFYSGHDTTMEPLLQALGLSDGSWPRYAARFVIEHYSHRHSKQHYVRFLYDGKPLTHLFDACINDHGFVDKHSLCPAKLLFKFVERHSQSYRLNCFKSSPPKAAEKMPREGNTE